MSYLIWLVVLIVARFIITHIPKKEDRVSEGWMKNYIYTSGKGKL